MCPYCHQGVAVFPLKYRSKEGEAAGEDSTTPPPSRPRSGVGSRKFEAQPCSRTGQASGVWVLEKP
jgi:hypothetical protein